MNVIGLTVLDLSRFQFAMTTIFHFFFVPFSIGMGVLVAIMETMYVVTKKPVYKKMTMFWSKIYLLSFAVGVVTGLIQEFQFGMNWSDYARFMGDIFGAPLAIEALLAFFLESVMIGIWVFTWDRFSPKFHCFIIWLVAIGSSVSALWILAANSFMQHPVGYAIENGRIVLKDFGKILTNPQLWGEFPHVIFASLVTASFATAGMAAWQLLKNKDKDFYTKTIKVALSLGTVSAVGAFIFGDIQGKFILEDQPMKFAAIEGIYNDTDSPAPWTLVENIDTKNHKTSNQVEIPFGLSIIAYNKLDGSVKGMNTINKEQHQKYDKKFGKSTDFYLPTKTLFWGFRFMMGFGFLFMLLGLIGVWMGHKQTLTKHRWFLYILGICTFAPFIATTSGWLITELGRSPWIVYGVYMIKDAVSKSTTVGMLIFSNVAFFLIFTMLAGFMIFYSRKVLQKGPDVLDSSTVPDPFAKGAFK